MAQLERLNQAIQQYHQRSQAHRESKVYFDELGTLVKEIIRDALKDQLTPTDIDAVVKKHEVDLKPVFSKLDKMIKAFESIEIPEPDLNPLFARIKSLETKISNIPVTEIDLTEVNSELLSIKGDIGGLHKSIASIPKTEMPEMPEPVKNWSFVVERNSEGFIQEVKAQAK